MNWKFWLGIFGFVLAIASPALWIWGVFLWCIMENYLFGAGIPKRCM